MKRLLPILLLMFSVGVGAETMQHEGGTYTGVVVNGVPHGHGTLTYPDGATYVGAWKDGKSNGQAIYTWANGDKYVGEYKDGKKHGHGTYTYTQGDKYVGEFKAGHRHGQATYTWPDGSKYVGEYKDGVEWTGRRYWPDGSDAVRYVDGEAFPASTCKVEERFKGTDGKPNIVQRCKGGRYIGEALNDQRHGQGTVTYTSGAKYVGEWMFGKKHGQATYTWVGGDKYVGEYRDGRKWKGIAYDKDNNVIATFLDGIPQ